MKVVAVVSTLLSVGQKIPQIIWLVRAGSARGISLPSLALEFWCYVTTTCYSLGLGIPLASFCEYPALVAQDFVVLLIVLHYRRLLNANSLSIFVLFLSFQLSLASGMFPTWLMSIIISGSIPITTTSKLMQLVKIVREKDSGDVSTTTWAIGALTRGARFYTFTVDVWNPPLAVNMFISSVLNGAVCVAAVWYRKRPESKEDHKTS